MAHPGLYMKEAAGKGRAMFTKTHIPAGTIIETAAVIVLSAEDRKLLDQTLLHDYIFEWTPGGEAMCCMALGNIPMYNHSYTSNCEHFMNYEDETMYIKTMRDITPGEELTINYNGEWNERKAVWFDVK
ncbi:MAG: SET domain-containing protein-lysine N-methyltransferase [Bacteroidetes bacterium 46-16]|nr:MAG: SET domain-containing protein-lysine N-methyltransferase [Bacteroidetes bacterium 46-16]